MKKLTIIIIIVVALCSCKKSFMNRSVIDALAIGELSEAMKSDSAFEKMYNKIQWIRDNKLKNDVDKAKWSGLTYKQFQKFWKYKNDKAIWLELDKKFENDWIEKYGAYYQFTVDSIEKSWDDYLEEETLENYVKIELVSISKEFYTNFNNSVYFGFRFTPLKGEIEKLEFDYAYTLKLYNKPKDEILYFRGITPNPINEPVILFWEVPAYDQNIFKDISVSTFLRDYYIYTSVKAIRINGVSKQFKEVLVPYSVKYYKSCNNKSLEKEVAVGMLIKEFTSMEYIGLSDYNVDESNKILKEYDKLSFDFFNLY